MPAYGRRAVDGVTVPRSARTWGVVIYAADRRYFVPGGDAAAAMALARATLPGIADNPANRVEFGNAENGWVAETVLRGGYGAANDR